MTDDKPIPFGGKWGAEREVSGSWVVVRYIDHGPGLHNRYERQPDGTLRNGEFFPRYLDTYAQAQARADELNSDEVEAQRARREHKGA